MEAPLYNQEGEKIGNIELSDIVFGVRWNPDVVHDVIRIVQMSRRANTAQVKGRGEVRGGGKKPWRQKGTGRARHGSTRSPIWVGGGVTHGPSTERNYERKINKNIKRLALRSVLSKKLHDGEILFIDDLQLAEPKTKIAASLLANIARGTSHEKLGKRGGRALVLIEKSETPTIRAIRNLPYADIIEARNINAEEALSPKFLIITKNAASKISS